MNNKRPISKTYPALLRELVENYGEREAVVGAGQRLTYQQLYEEVGVVARSLLRLGVKYGDHVGVLMGNRPEWITAFFACHFVGATVIALNTWATPRELEYALNHAGVSVLIASEGTRSSDFRNTVTSLRGRLPALRHCIWVGSSGRDTSSPDYTWDDCTTLAQGHGWQEVEAAARQVKGDDIAFLLYSSGSTAAPKGILLRHRAAIENGWNIGERQHVTCNDRIWLVVSIFWSFGSVNATTNILTHGGCLVLQERFDPGEALRLIESERCTVFYGTPNMAYAMQEHPDRRNRDLSSLRTGAAIGTPDQLLGIVNMGVRDLCNIYGQTETYGNCVVTDASLPLELRLRTVGKPLPGVQLEIFDIATDKPLPPGKEGEIRVSGPYVFAGYLNDPEQTNKAFDLNGWFRTGDLGYLDKDGYLYYRGRISEMIKTGGINVAPAEVEEILMSYPGVRVAFVIGLPDPIKDQELAAIVVPAPDAQLTTSELVAHCKRELAAYKVPSRLCITTENALPLTTTGKVRKAALAKLFEASETKA